MLPRVGDPLRRIATKAAPTSLISNTRSTTARRPICPSLKDTPSRLSQPLRFGPYFRTFSHESISPYGLLFWQLRVREINTPQSHRDTDFNHSDTGPLVRAHALPTATLSIGPSKAVTTSGVPEAAGTQTCSARVWFRGLSRRRARRKRRRDAFSSVTRVEFNLSSQQSR